MFRLSIVLFLLCLLADPAVTQQPGTLPIPRFVAIDRDVANMRSGPGRQYPIIWVYKRADLPLKVVGENGPWRQVEDMDGTRGWMHVRLLTGRRTAVLKGEPGAVTRSLYKGADSTTGVELTAESGVTGRLMACQSLWCELRIGSRRGWIERRHIWGVFAREEFE